MRAAGKPEGKAAARLGGGHEQTEPGLLCAAGRARLPQPLQAAGRVSGGPHGGNQGNGLGQRGPPLYRALLPLHRRDWPFPGVASGSTRFMGPPVP